MLKDRLSGQTITTAFIDFEDDSSILTFELAGVDNPVVFDFNKNGQTSFSFKDRKHILKR